MKSATLFSLLRTRLSVGASTVAIATGLAAAGLTALPAFSQNMDLPGISAPSGDGNMLLESDQLVYDYDAEVISAVGNVKIYYDGHVLEADRVSYDQATGRLLATGRVEITQPDGYVLNAEQIDITDDFREGFVGALRISTPDKTYFAASRAERLEGRFTRLERGVYTACEPCAEHPEKPPQWQVKAARIIHDQEERMVYFYRASLELFGMPIIWLPYFATPDPTVRRKSGFLAPEVGYRQSVGVFVGVPYFWNLAPNYDITFSPRYYSNQGFMPAVEWRHRLRHGVYSFTAAGIHQRNPGLFDERFSQQDWRGGIRATGNFNLGGDWTLGWDGTLLSDRAFIEDYRILYPSERFVRSQVNLTGLRDRNYFDLRAYHFLDTTLSSAYQYNQGRQGVVHPVLDYQKILARPFLGGQVSFDTNLTSISRREDDPFQVEGNPATYYWGTAGTRTRLTQQVAWERVIGGPWGQQFKPFAFARGDALFLDPNASAAGLSGPANARGIAGVGLEWRWPWLFTAGKTTHVVEPIAQIIARPGVFGFSGQTPNDDAHSLVFDDTTLFEWDKFSGYDLIETGTRLNVGLRYSGRFGPATVDAVFGQSFQLAGPNAFAAPNLTNTGFRSGLETARSDYVAGLTTTFREFSVGARARFDEQTFRFESGTLEARTRLGGFYGTTSIAYYRDFPFGNEPRRDVFQINAQAQQKLGQYLTLTGGISYDVTGGYVDSDYIGLGYADECLLVSVQYEEDRDSMSKVSSRSVMLRLQLRTLGDFGVRSALPNF